MQELDVLVPPFFIDKVVMSVVVVLEHVQESTRARRGRTRKWGDTRRERGRVKLFE